MKILFAGTPEFSVIPLQKLAENYEVAAVVTQPDRPQGRKGILTPPPVKRAAEELGIPVIQPEKISGSVDLLKGTGTDVMFTCAYGQILSQSVLDCFEKGVWNLHASLLPAYRGAAPIARALIDGRNETGVTVMKTELGLDTGDILLAQSCPIFISDDCKSLEDRLSLLSGELALKAAEMIARGELPLKKQGEGFTCKKVERTEVDFSRSAREVSCLIRGLSPSPLAYAKAGDLTVNFFFAEEVPYRGEEPCGFVLHADLKEGLVVKCGENAVRILSLQSAGSRRMSARDFINGRKLREGDRFENQSVL